ncbi:hypothetical protein M8J76_007604 [Diaphorina citri]|nr:hypothetical protein M8J76_007604 [Diaphorina citri]
MYLLNELKYKKRLYKLLNLDEKQLKALHTRSNLKRFLEYVNNSQVEKIAKLCAKGLDPNFHCPETGETPLTLATKLKKCSKILMNLVNGGAILDFRTRDGTTSMHKAVEHNNVEAVTTLLELGASPNYKDAKGITPLYVSITHQTDPVICETLLHDRAVVGIQDQQGWQEVHQACRNGLAQHLEHLLFYGADSNARNASGNTPLHVCAVNGTEACARVLLFRGAQREALNFAHQSPYQVAVIAGNLELAEVIRNHHPADIVPFRDTPRYNPRRRASCLIRGSSLDSSFVPPSPSLSNRSSMVGGPCFFSSASSSLSEASSGSNSTHKTEDTASYITDKSIGDTSDIMSESSGIGTNSDSTITLPGTTVVCVEAYRSNQPGHLSIQQGDILEVTGATDCGLLEGSPRGRNLTGLFPPHCVQEVRLRHPPPQSSPYTPYQGGGGGLSHQNSIKHYATTPRQKTRLPAQARTVILHRSRRGFGFVLRGAKAASPLMETSMCSVYPGLQYLDDVDRGGVADMAGLKKGDFLVAINGEDVSTASHERVVDLIRKSGDLVNMTVVSLHSVPNASEPIYKSMSSTPQQYATLPRKLSSGRPAPLPPRRDPKTTLSVGRARAKSMFAGMEGGCNDGEEKKSSEYRTASIRRPSSQHRVSPATLESMFHPKQSQGQHSPDHNGALVYASVAEMKRRGKPSSSRVRFSTALDNLPILPDLHRTFHSTPDLAAVANQTRSRTHNSSSEDNVTALDGGRSLPPPTHPPPPPPIAGTLVKVDLKPVPTAEMEAKECPGPGNISASGLMSSFKPSNNAKLYASPEDIKSVGFRPRPLSTPNSRTPVQKTHSLRSQTSSFKEGTSTPSPGGAHNPYAQPIRNGGGPRGASPPPTPEPDYSLSENSDTECTGRLPAPPPPLPETGVTMSQSFSIDEIKKVRTQLKSSKSYHNEFAGRNMNGGGVEDGDNSSSGVSSDQEVTSNPGGDENTSNTRYSLGNQKSKQSAVSLKQLPPPLEIELEEKDVLSVVPPPPEFIEHASCLASEAVLAPPPQFSDSKMVSVVRIVGAVPKSKDGE